MAQCQVPTSEGNGVGPQLITVGGGPGNIEQQVASMDFAQMMINQQNRKQKENEERQAANKELISSGAVSPLDLDAPSRAVHEYNAGIEQLRSQHSPEAIEHLQKAIAAYPKFVSAHNAMGLALSDMDDSVRAKSEFETAMRMRWPLGKTHEVRCSGKSKLYILLGSRSSGLVMPLRCAPFRPSPVI